MDTFNADLVALHLVNEVKAINPTATVVKNYEKDKSIVIRHINNYVDNLGDAFKADPFKFLDPTTYK